MTGRAIIQRSADGENSIGTCPLPFRPRAPLPSPTSFPRRQYATYATRGCIVHDHPLTSVLHAGANFANPGAAPQLDGFTHLLLQNEIPLEDTLAYLLEAGKRSLTTVYNPSPMPTREQLQAFPWSCLTHLIVNEGELSDIAIAFDAAPKGASVAETATAQMKALSGAKGFNPAIMIVTTIGPEGVLVFDPRKGDEVRSWPAAKVKKVVDTTGAGDTFAGYFVSLLMEKGDDTPADEIVPICLQVSCATMSLKVSVDARLVPLPSRPPEQWRALQRVLTLMLVLLLRHETMCRGRRSTGVA